MTLKLRKYQQDSVDSVFEYWGQKKGKNPLIVLPTAAGKSLVQADFALSCFKQYNKVRILCVTHVKELVDQNELEMLEYWKDAPTGVYAASLKRRENTQILFASIQSIYKKAFEFAPFDIVCVDECHLIPSKDSGMYQRFLKDSLIGNPKMKVVGMTATPFRLDGGSLIGGEKSLFDGIAHNVPMKQLMDDGYISKLTAKEGIAHIESSALSKQGGEFKSSDQITEFHKDDLTRKALSEIVKLGESRKGWMVFCSKVEHAEECAKILNEEYKIPTACVHGGLKKERDQLINDFKSMKLRCLVSVNILTTGFNAKHVDLIGMLRATASAALWLQIIGRGIRLFPKKDNCLVLDYGENILRHGVVDEIVDRQLDLGAKKKGKKGAAVMKRCPKCDEMCYASVRQCPNCFTFFDISTLPKIQRTAARLAITSSERERKSIMFDVSKVYYNVHKKVGKPDSVKVTYSVGNMKSFSEWVCFDHQGFARSKAIQWLKDRYSGFSESTITTKSALDLLANVKIKEPKSITVITGSKYPEIVSYSF